MSGRSAKRSRVRTRTHPRHSDLRALRRLVESTGVFYPEEIEIAMELLEERLRRGARSGYEFIFADRAGELVGYCAWGAVPLTKGSYDLYWIATHPAFQGGGVGTLLLDEVERRLRQREARMLVVETSSRSDYTATRKFYETRGYNASATVTDFYAPGDHRVIYAKRFLESEVPVVLIHSRQNAESSRNE